MARTQEICSTLAQTLGLSLKEVTEVARRIREAGYFVKETRSKESPRATPGHIANLLLALMSGNSTRKVAQAVERFEFTHRLNQEHWDFSNNPELAKFFKEEMPSFVYKDATLVCAVADMIRIARDRPDVFTHQFSGMSLTINQRTYTGSINLVVNEYDPLRKMVYSGPLDFIHDDYVEADRWGDLSVQSGVTCFTFDAIGHLLRRDDE